MDQEDFSVPTERFCSDGRLRGYFYFEVVFNSRDKVLSNLEIRVLSKGLWFSLAPSFINCFIIYEADLRRDLADFSKKMRCKWYFRNEIGENFSETTAFRTKSIWNPPNSPSALEMFLSKVKENFFLVLPVKVSSYNLTKGE